VFSYPQRLLALASAGFLIPPVPTKAMETPLSDTAVREAYFLGQHHDEIFSDFIQKYGVTLPTPKTGPQIASVAFLTPYALTAINSNRHAGVYSAQQAQIDHDRALEVVRVVIQIWLTSSYGVYIVQPGDSRTAGPRGLRLRSPDFWRDFRVRVIQRDQLIIPMTASGEPQWNCGPDSGCELSGAAITFEYSAKVFVGDTATVLVTPPEGDPVSVDFDLTSLR